MGTKSRNLKIHETELIVENNLREGAPKVSNITLPQEQEKVETQKFFVNIEDKEYPWAKETITVPEIRQLGNIPSDQQIIEEVSDGSERTLAENEIVIIKPGHRHGRAPKYRRGM